MKSCDLIRGGKIFIAISVGLPGRVWNVRNCAVQFSELRRGVCLTNACLCLSLIRVRTGGDECAGWCRDSRETRDECSPCRQRMWSAGSRNVDRQAPIFSTKHSQQSKAVQRQTEIYFGERGRVLSCILATGGSSTYLIIINVKINVALSENASRTRYTIKIKLKLRKWVLIKKSLGTGVVTTLIRYGTKYRNLWASE